MDLYPFKSQEADMEPIALQDYLVAIHYVKGIFYRRVSFLEGLPPFQCANLGAIAAAAVSQRTNVTALDLYDLEFGQFRIFPLDNVQLRVFLPRGSARGDLKTTQVPIDPTVVTRNPSLNMTEFCVWEDNRPAIEAVNGQAVAVVNSRVIAMGFRYQTDDPGNPMSYKEMQAVEQIKAQGKATGKTDADLLIQAIKEKRVDCTHIWASGRSASN